MLDPRRCGCGFHIMAPYQTGWPATNCPAADGHTGKGRADAERLAARERLADGDIFDYPSGTGRHHDHPLGENTASWIEWVTSTTVRFLLLPETQQVTVEFVTRNFIQRRRAHPSAAALVRVTRPAGDGDAHLHHRRESFARQDVGELAEAHQLKNSLTRCALRARHAGQIQRQPDVIAHAAPRHQGGFYGERTTADAGPFPDSQHTSACVADARRPAAIFNRVLYRSQLGRTGRA